MAHFPLRYYLPFDGDQHEGLDMSIVSEALGKHGVLIGLDMSLVAGRWEVMGYSERHSSWTVLGILDTGWRPLLDQ